ncbi:MAG: ribbon-helix-helix protein, CopG family [Henriciella sp.]
MSKPRVNLRLSHKLHAALDRRARAPGVTKTDIVEEALSRFFDPESNRVLE